MKTIYLLNNTTLDFDNYQKAYSFLHDENCPKLAACALVFCHSKIDIYIEKILIESLIELCLIRNYNFIWEEQS
jgi:hypothetical protein